MNRGCPTLATSLYLWLGWETMNTHLRAFHPEPAYEPGCPTLATPLYLWLGWETMNTHLRAFHPEPAYEPRVPHPRHVFVFVARVGCNNARLHCLRKSPRC